MKRTHGKSMFFLILMSTALLVGIAVAGEPATGSVNQVRDRWAQINYQLPKPQREAAFEELLHQSEKIRQATPRDAAALIWEGIVLSSLAIDPDGIDANYGDGARRHHPVGAVAALGRPVGVGGAALPGVSVRGAP